MAAGSMSLFHSSETCRSTSVRRHGLSADKEMAVASVILFPVYFKTGIIKERKITIQICFDNNAGIFRDI
jgi:hypothetical protein